MTADLNLDQWPVAIIEDRYGGAYSAGKWIAIAQADTAVFDTPYGEDYETRAEYLLSEGPHGGDPDAAEFWLAAPDWIAVGDTPDEALANLRAGVKATGR